MALQVEALLWMPGGEDWTKPAELDARVWAAAIGRPNWPARTDFRREILGPVLG